MRESLAREEQDPGWGELGALKPTGDWRVAALSRAKEGHGAGKVLRFTWALNTSQHHLCRDKALPTFSRRQREKSSSVYTLLCCLDSSPVIEILILHPI